ncbi:hypothetical protein PCANC_07720 [Puccinia coronata f. sp. avenae]|uniref:Uncharacterized protein n=1 Tax=Puccinia coronata f. sp. avenae TaxID=200324 RepID=A0A2N5V201_9BASI|nr:hypothetical protein PCASD_04883 [Puccinia coronata f. sp. avenae]PLW52535.1 hypothetical protein PCANC_07720 [Puccinia coronata f. sp. avenae]
MHRLVYMKFKSRALQDSNRSPSSKQPSEEAKEPSPASSTSVVPVLELSLRDSKSFRASVILPDLSRRFTLLRTNGELLPINNFRQHLRHELETGHITQQDENLLMNQYRQQYLSESSSPSSNHLDHTSPISPTDSSSSNIPSPPPKSSSTAISVLFSGNTSARDAAYIHKTLKMSKLASANTPRPRLEPTVLEEPTVAISTADTTPTTSPKTLDHFHSSIHSIPPSSPNQFDPMDEWEGENDIELTPTQVQRLSLAVDRILGSHLCQEHQPAEARPDELHHIRHASSPLDAEFRVHEELFRALPENSSTPSLPASSSSHLTRSQPNTSQQMSNTGTQFLDATRDSTPEADLCALSLASEPSSSEDTMDSQFYRDNVDDFFAEHGLSDHVSVFGFASELDDLPEPAPMFDRQQTLPFIDIPYDDVLFIQQALVSSLPHASSSSSQTRFSRKIDHTSVRLPSPTPSHSRGSMVSSHPRQRKLSSSPSFRDRQSSLSSQDRNPPLLSPRTSALQQRLNLAKAAGIGACQRMRTLRQPNHETAHPPVEESSPNGAHGSFPQLVSPSMSDSPDASSFPLTPPTHHFARSPPMDETCIPSPSMSADLITGESKEAPPRNFNSRAGRPTPTTVLFKDVEAQAIAANIALRKASSQEAEHQAKSRKPLLRKKGISTARIGAPKLLSASLDVNAAQLEQTEVEGRSSFSQKTRSFSKGTFRLRLGKKRPSESAINQRSTNYSVDEPTKPLKSFGSNPNLRGSTVAVNGNSPSCDTRESITGSPTTSFRLDAQDHPGSPTLRKHPNALSSFLKLMDRHRKSGSNHTQPIKLDQGPSSPPFFSGTSHTSPPEKPSPPVPHRRPRTNTKGSSSYHTQPIKLDQGPCSPLRSPGTISSVYASSEKATPPARLRRPRTNTKGTVAESDLDERPGSPFKSVSPPSRSRDSGHEYAYTAPIPLRQLSPGPHRQNSPSPPPGFALVVDEEKEVPLPQPLGTKPVAESTQGTSSSSSSLSSSFDVSVSVTGPVKGADDDDEAQESLSKAATLDAEKDKVGGSSSKWLEVQTNDPYEGRSDYASSILDLYGGDSHSREPDGSPCSTGSRYSLAHEASLRRRDSEVSNPGLGQPLKPTPSSTSTTGSDRPVSPGANVDAELMGLVQQLQSSTRFSKFDPNPSSLNLHDDLSPDAFRAQNLPRPPVISPLFSPRLGGPDELEDQEEAQVWKQILDG